MNLHNLDHIRFVTRYFRSLQGLRFMMPFGLIVTSLGLFQITGGVPGLPAAVLLSALCLMLIANFTTAGLSARSSNAR